jgi:hypothetical protein
MTMDEIQKQAVLSAIRTLLGIAGGYFVGKGLVTEEVMAQVVGAIMALVPLAWGMWNAKRSEERAQEREVVAVNAGIAVADSTVGPTPAVSKEQAPAVIAAHAK